jgi:hypothetical protein
MRPRSWGNHLETPPLIRMQGHPNKRPPYPLSIEEERLLFSDGTVQGEHGSREQEVVNLNWSWETRVPELDTSIFVIPRSFVKNGLDRYVVLNRIAKSLIR